MPSVGAGLFSVGLASAGGVGTRVGAAFVEVFADTSGVTRGFAATEAQLKTFSGRMQATGAGMGLIGAKMTRYLTVPLVAAAGVAVKFAADFDQAMARTSALAGIAQKDVAGFRKEILSLSGETAVAPEELANTLYFVGSAGLKAAEVMPVLKLSAQAAAAEMTDAATAGHLLSGVLVAYGKDAPTASQAMDVLTAAIRGGKAEPADLADNLGTVIPVAAEMGIGFDELAGSIAAMTNVNIPAARAATGLRYMLIQMQNPTEAAKKAMEEFGLSSGEVQRAVEDDLVGGLKMLADTLDLTTTKGREAFFTIVGGTRSGQAALALIGKNFERTKEIMDSTAKAAGDTGDEFHDAYEKMTQTDAFAFRQAWNDLKLAAIDAGEAILPVARQIVDAVGGVFKGFADLPKAAQQTIIWFGAVVAAAGPVIAIYSRLYKLAGQVGSVFKGIANLGMKVAGAATPATSLTAGGEAAGAALISAATEAAAILTAGGEAAGAAMLTGAEATAGADLFAGMTAPANFFGAGAAGAMSKAVPPPNFFGAGAAGEFESLTGSLAGVEGAAAGASAELAGVEGAAVGAGAGAATGASGLAGMATGLGEFAAILGGVAIAGGLLNRVVSAYNGETEDMVAQTKLSTQQVEMVGHAFNNSAANLNLFTDKQDKTLEAGKMYAQVLKEARDAGMNMDIVQRELAAHFDLATEKIGGLTGSMPAFKQQLEAIIGLAKSPEVVDFVNNLNTMEPIVAPEVQVPGGLPPPDELQFQPTVTPQLDMGAFMANWQSTIDDLEASGWSNDVEANFQGLIDDINGALEGGGIKTLPDLMESVSQNWRQLNIPAEIFLGLLNDMQDLSPETTLGHLGPVVENLTEDARGGAITWERYNQVLKDLETHAPFKSLGPVGDILREQANTTMDSTKNLAGLIKAYQTGAIEVDNLSQHVIATAIHMGDFDFAAQELSRELKDGVNQQLKEMGGRLSKATKDQIAAAMKAGHYTHALELVAKAQKEVNQQLRTEAIGGLRKYAGQLSSAQRNAIQAAIDTGHYRGALKLLNDEIANFKPPKKSPKVDVDTKPAQGKMDALTKRREAIVDLAVRQSRGAGSIDDAKKRLGDLDRMTAKPKVTAKDTNTDTIKGKLKALGKPINTKVKVDDGGTAAIVQGQIDDIHGKTVTVFVRTQEITHGGGVAGRTGAGTMQHFAGRKAGEVDSRLQAGEFVVNRTASRRNSALLRAINDNDKTGMMRELARRGGGKGGGARVVAGAQVNVHLTVNGNQDPRTIATMVGAEIARKVGVETGGFSA